MLIKLTSDVIDIAEALAHVRDATCGAVTMFEGDIRNNNQGEHVIDLEYEVYEALFHKQIARIAEEAKAKWQIHETAVIQRTGLLQVGDAGLVVCVSSAHRKDALEALSYMIEEFKTRAPVWKKERTEHSEKWINWSPQK